MQADPLFDHRFKDAAPVQVLLYLYGRERRLLLLAFIPWLIKSSPVWLMPLLTAALIDVVANPARHSFGDLIGYAAVMLVLIVQNIPMNILFVRGLSSATRNLERHLRLSLVERLQQISMDFYHRNSTGALQAKLLRDVELIQQLTVQLYDSLLYALVSIVFAVIVTGLRAPWFLIFFLVTVPAAVVLIRVMNRPLRQQNEDFRTTLESMSARLTEMLRLIPVTRAHGLEQTEIDTIEQQLARVRAAGRQLDTINAVFGATSWVTFRFFDALCLIIASAVAYAQLLPITVGDVVLLTGFFSNLTGAVMQITNLLPQLSKGLESIHSIGEVLQYPDLEHNDGKRKLERIDGAFTFEQVTFTYPDTAEASLVDITLTVEPGETIAVIGPSGAGKSTLLKLIIGFIRPASGRILLDGHDMQTLDLSSYRRFVAVVPQETILFRGSIRDNILYGLSAVSEQALQAALHAANCTEFIAALPAGVDTLIGENGITLSGGQRQRIAIARALMRDPRVLLLDEATSALDTASEKLIQEALGRLLHNRTTFVVAHRLSTIRSATRIVVLAHGRIVEVGSHDALLARGGLYTDWVTARA